MSTEEPRDSEADGGDGADVRDRLEREADRAVEGFDEGIVDLLAWVLDTETRARIYVYLRQHPQSTSEEVAEGTGLYPSTVREALAALHGEGKVTREKRENSGAGNNPYEYAAIAPSDLVGEVVEEVQRELNAVFNLDRLLGTENEAGDEDDDEDGDEVADEKPVTITVEDDSEGDGTDDSGASADETGEGASTGDDPVADEPAGGTDDESDRTEGD